MLSPMQMEHVVAVPTLVMDDGSMLVGTKAFEWLAHNGGESQVDFFDAGQGLAFSSIDDDGGSITYASRFAPFH